MLAKLFFRFSHEPIAHHSNSKEINNKKEIRNSEKQLQKAQQKKNLKQKGKITHSQNEPSQSTKTHKHHHQRAHETPQSKAKSEKNNSEEEERTHGSGASEFKKPHTRDLYSIFSLGRRSFRSCLVNFVVCPSLLYIIT